jgi:putative sigma-54 modulation protein
MEIKIHGLNVKVNEGLETFARKKLERLNRYLPGITNVNLELSHQNSKRGDNLNIAQITVHHRRGAILRAEERAAGDFEIAINQSLDKMYRQIERFKGKRTAKGRERFSASLEELDEAEAIPELPEDAIVEIEPEVIRRKNVAVTAMNEDEAIAQMELLGHNFFMFYNTTTGSVNVVYKRTSGGYGLLQPQVE